MKWLVFFGSDYTIEAETPLEAADRYAGQNDWEPGQTIIVVEQDPSGPAIHRFRLGAIEEPGS